MKTLMLETIKICLTTSFRALRWHSAGHGQFARRALNPRVSAAALLLAHAVLTQFCQEAPAGYVYWSTTATTGPNTSDSKIKRARLDGSETATIISAPTSGRFGGIAFDVNNSLLYSGDGNTLFRANLDGSNRTVLVTNTFVADVELDLVHGKVYWSDNLHDVINYANLDGTAAETIITLSSVDNVEGLALDPVGGHLFLTYNSSPPTSAILVANLDGTGMTTFKSLGSTDGPFDIEVDTVSNLLYWNEFHGGVPPQQFRQTQLDGTGPVILAFSPTNGLNNGFHFDPVDGKIYYNGRTNDLTRANPDGSNMEFLVSESDGLNYVEVVRPRPTLAISMYAGLTISGQTGVAYQIQYSTNLISPTNWVALTNLTLPSSPYLFFDATSSGRPMSFYRALLLD